MTGKPIPGGYEQVSRQTADDLRTIATTVKIRKISRLTLPEIESLSDEVARVVPAGNAPAMILSGLANLRTRQVDITESRKHIHLLFRGVRQSLDEAMFAAFFGGPAAILYGYQLILRLAGKEIDDAFPEGTWQFYLEMGLREDSARHANETTGFYDHLRRQDVTLSEADRLAVWALTAAYTLRQLPDLIAAEWHEQVSLRLLAHTAHQFKQRNAAEYGKLHAVWNQHRPYRLERDAAPGESYPVYRQRVFENFVAPHINGLPRDARKIYLSHLTQAEHTALPAYQSQLSWLAYLDPGQYSETRIPYPLKQAHIGVIWNGRYSLIPATALLDIQQARALMAEIAAGQSGTPPAVVDDVLVNVPREAQQALRKTLKKATRQELEQIRYAPILINGDTQRRDLSLATIRRGKRGIGDHPLTIFQTPNSTVFDMSHIFFDGAWGAAIAEIMTNEATTWTERINAAPDVPQQSGLPRPATPTLFAPTTFINKAQKKRIPAETSAESTGIRLQPMLELRKLLKQRNDLATVTVNDLLLLYRGIHARLYEPSPTLRRALRKLGQDRRKAAKQAHALITDSLNTMKGKNPAILIPIDARPYEPRERVFPTAFRNPFTDFWEQHQRTYRALIDYQNATDPNTTFQHFHDAQVYYLRLIAGFGELLDRYKNIARAGQSTSVATIKLLGHLPEPLQKLLDNLPSRIDVLNEVIKGEEVFSNVGQVARGSTLRRFITAKDDNEQKTLMWGVLTDDDGVVHLSLRDFRPHVQALHDLGEHSLAQQITQDYVDSYTEGLNIYIEELRRITIASRERAAVARPPSPVPHRAAIRPKPAARRRWLLPLIAMIVVAVGLVGALLLSQVLNIATPTLGFSGNPTPAPAYWQAVQFTYDPDGFYLISRSNSRIQSVGRLEFRADSGGSLFEGIRWSRIYSTLEPHNCMALTFINEVTDMPQECARPNALMQLSRTGPFIFWQGSFHVYWNGQPIAACPGGTATCRAALPPA